MALAGTAVYLLTLEPSTSFWDCGEFIAISYYLQVGHPPGAPLYQLLAHAFSWLAGGDVMAVARCCNALSAVAGGLTVMFLYWTIRLLGQFPDSKNVNSENVNGENVNGEIVNSELTNDGSRPTIHNSQFTIHKKGNSQFTIHKKGNSQFSIHKNGNRIAAVVGALCYMFCDTAWFSAVESEVYSLAMLLASATLWAMLRWYGDDDGHHAHRWLLLVALLVGLGVCVHMLTLLVTPVLLLLFIFRCRDNDEAKSKHSIAGGRAAAGKARIRPNAGNAAEGNTGSPVLRSTLRLLPLLFLFFVVGLSPYLIIPIRAAAGTPINEGNPSSAKAFREYFGREQYQKAPIYPRMWRHRENDATYNASWCGGDTSLVGNLQFLGSYQLTYMYVRYLMWNFAGRYNDRQGYGSPQNGQFITGLRPIDRMLVGTGLTPPASLHTRGHNVYYLLPLLLGILGLAALADNKKAFWTVMTLFLMGGVVLSLYLNHPCYEPRERDYAYILSFYAFAIFIAFGAAWVAGLANKRFGGRNKKSGSPRTAISKGSGTPRNVATAPRPALCVVLSLLLLGVPLLMACQNWDDHDRSGRYIAHDAGANILNSCDTDERGTVLFCYGDNDTFPLWYLQTVEETRPDVRVENIGIMGWRAFLDLLNESMDEGRPVYFTHYAYNQYRNMFEGHFQLEGNAYRLMDAPCDSVAVGPCYRHFVCRMGWHDLAGVYVDEVGCKFVEQYWRDALLLAQNLVDMGRADSAVAVLDKTLGEIPTDILQDVALVYNIGHCYRLAGCNEVADSLFDQLRVVLEEQLAYFHSMSPSRQAVMPYTLAPREETYAKLLNGE